MRPHAHKSSDAVIVWCLDAGQKHQGPNGVSASYRASDTVHAHAATGARAMDPNTPTQLNVTRVHDQITSHRRGRESEACSSRTEDTRTSAYKLTSDTH